MTGRQRKVITLEDVIKMRCFLDTNILLDFLLPNRPGQDDAKDILLMGNAGYLNLLVSDLTIANIAYITRKEISREDFYRVMTTLQRCYAIVPLGQAVMNSALAAKWDDFEDALQYYSAVQAGADCIITRNTKDYTQAELPIITPKDFLKK